MDVNIKTNIPNLKLTYDRQSFNPIKLKKAVKLFDYIHSLDSAKLALKIFNLKKN